MTILVNGNRYVLMDSVRIGEVHFFTAVLWFEGHRHGSEYAVDGFGAAHLGKRQHPCLRVCTFLASTDVRIGNEPLLLYQQPHAHNPHWHGLQGAQAYGFPRAVLTLKHMCI